MSGAGSDRETAGPAAVEVVTLVRSMVGTDRYGGLLLALLGSVVLFGVVRDIPFGGLVRGTVFALSLVFAVRAAGVHWRRAGMWLAAAAIAVIVPLFVDAIVAGHTVPFVADLVGIFISLLTGGLVALRLVRHSRISLATILGALCVYLVLGMLFSSTFAILTLLDPAFFTAPHVRPVEYLYFSFGQLTTAGSPPLTPGTDLARMLAILEALVGQMYLVTVVALLVGNLGRTRSAR
ncbi:MAG: ion channel [Candidatus Dormibacteraceae bacterium]